MSTSETLSISATAVGKHRLDVVAQKTADADRWMHRFELQCVDEVVVLLSSIEGNAENLWPLSPPLQEINLHDLGNGEALLAVGMAGKSHWSMSLSSAEPETLVVDLACLVKQGPDQKTSAACWLGSTYLLHDSASAKIISPESIEITFNGAAIRMSARTVGEFASTLSLSENLISIMPSVDIKSATGQQRWCFELVVSDLI